MDGSLAHNLAVVDHLDHSLTNGAVGGEHAVFYGTHGAVSQLPGDISRDLSSAADSVRADSGDLNGGFGGHILVLGGQHSAVELAVALGGGVDDQAGGNRTLSTVGGSVSHLDGIGALGLGAVSSGATFVILDGGHAAQLDEQLAQLITGQTHRLGSLVAVGVDEDHLVISGDTHSGAGILCSIGGSIGILAFPDQNLVAAYALPDLVGVGVVLTGLANDGGAVLQDGEEGVAIGIAAVAVNAFHIERAGGLTRGHIVVGAVHSDDSGILLATLLILLLGGGDLLGHLCHAVVDTLSADIAGLNTDSVNIQIRHSDEQLNTVAVLVQNDALVLGDTGRKSRLFVRNQCHFIRHRQGSENGSGQNANHHHHSQQCRQKPLEGTVFHGFTLLF